MFVLNHFKIMKNSKVAHRKENGGQILLKWRLLGDPERKKLRMKKIKKTKLFKKKKEFEKLFAN